ncbi:hybrid sensor histidine kinase/response regulator [Dyella choica]|uniref:Chemotaxis protein CheA n=1 Tax=Dyella choica TaxID=1927959 RepID=A0A3S0S1E5_9GAMM|nr:hybrid sensor histidine kinase/response regulator [Dyella choica]RUL77564.1 hybrid sensor histidine kinase/response regulator [Dyella choica]
MMDLFRLETESQVQVLTSGLLALERDSSAPEQLEACMRAAHSLKGAARIVDIAAGVNVAHAMEDIFVAAQHGTLRLKQPHIDVLLRGLDLFNRIANTAESHLVRWTSELHAEVDAHLADSRGLLTSSFIADEAITAAPQEPAAESQSNAIAPSAVATAAGDARDSREQALRITANHLNRLLGLAGEALVDSRQLRPFVDSLLKLKRLHYGARKAMEELHHSLPTQMLNERDAQVLETLHDHIARSQELLADNLVGLENFAYRSSDLANRLYHEAVTCRMLPFADGVRGLPRMARDVARGLGKQVHLEIVGESTQVDREVLEKLEAPLGHLIRNAIDHGICLPDERIALGKAAEGTIRLEARHNNGMLMISVSDDGRGISLPGLREAIVRRNLTTAEMAGRLSDEELLEFLFLPGFTMRDSVTEISGRGVGLDVVQDMVKRLRGKVHISTSSGEGARFQLQLPLSLSVVRALLVDIHGERYAFPLSAIHRTLKLTSEAIQLLEGRQFFMLNADAVGLISARQVLHGDAATSRDDELSVVVVGHTGQAYGLVVDHLLSEHELVVRTLDPRLGKIKDIAAGALTEDGSPVLIVDTDELVQSIDKLISEQRLSRLHREDNSTTAKRRRVLVVDDSLTVRELQRSLLDGAGYEVEVAVDGMDGWNAIRTGRFDMLVTDIDMPRMDGMELVAKIKRDPHLKDIPVLIVSYKDREEDRLRGLEAGADYYLTKGSFHDDSLLQAVIDLIGEANA